MYDNLKKIYIDSSTSKIVLKSISSSQKIDFKKLNILHLKPKIKNLIKNYNNIKKKDQGKSFNARNFIFWKMAMQKLKNINVKFLERKQNKKEDYLNIHTSELRNTLGFIPSLLTILLFSNDIKRLLVSSDFFKSFENAAKLENINVEKKLKIIELIRNKKTLNLITPLCPDYEHVKISENLYKYTFEKLNEGYGLIGKKLLKIIEDVHNLLKKKNINFKHHILYGDFEAYSETNCKRLKISEKDFINKLTLSKKKLIKKLENKKISLNCDVGLLVTKISSKKKWLNLCQSNFKKINNLYKIDIRFKKSMEQILESRNELYKNWYPNLEKNEYLDLLFYQGAEYTTMGNLFFKNFKNPIVLGLDHPKMKIFYDLNNKIPVIYGHKTYK